MQLPVSKDLKIPSNTRALFQANRDKPKGIPISEIFCNDRDEPTNRHNINTKNWFEILSNIVKEGDIHEASNDNSTKHSFEEDLDVDPIDDNPFTNLSLEIARFKSIYNDKSNCYRAASYYYPITQYIISHHDQLEKSITAYVSLNRGGISAGLGGAGPGGKGADGESEREVFELNEFLAQHGNVEVCDDGSNIYMYV